MTVSGSYQTRRNSPQGLGWKSCRFDVDPDQKVREEQFLLGEEPDDCELPSEGLGLEGIPPSGHSEDEP